MSNITAHIPVISKGYHMGSSDFLIHPDKFAKTVEIPVRIRKGNKIEFFYDGQLPNIEDGTLARLILPAYAVREEDKLLTLSAEKTVELLPQGSVLFLTINMDTPHEVDPVLLQKVRDSQRRLEKIRELSPGTFGTGGPVEIILEEPLYLILRGTKLAKLKNCTCYIPLLGKQVSSLNQAYYHVSQALEVHRASHGGSAFLNMFIIDDKRCLSLDELREIKRAEEEYLRFINKENKRAKS